MVSEQGTDHYFEIFIHVEVTIAFLKCYKREQNPQDTAYCDEKVLFVLLQR